MEFIQSYLMGAAAPQGATKKLRHIQKRLGAGMLVVNEEVKNQEFGNFLPLKEINLKVVIHDSISTI